ncbi:hypothetical protein SAMN04488094_10367 [Tropicimonas isoalkanivorans]|uniref:Uncharacterized protein n=2 Tax=Tropicimonas isoalkanivorans TaxID=441112 RepID=A0A1I1HEG9_9RHOB|nr:hypothetical protein SAMN04488094_10367 [Tropicimonas isoalkanivorans]
MQTIAAIDVLGDVRKILNATGLHKTYGSVAEMLASSDTVREGEIVGVPALGHWYVGAKPGAGNPHLTMASGSGLHVMPRSKGVWHAGAWGLDPTGQVPCHSEVDAAIQVALQSSDTPVVLMPSGTFLFRNKAGAALTRDQRFTLKGTGATTIYMAAGGFSIQGEEFLTTTLAEAVGEEDRYALLTDVTGIEVGDTFVVAADVSLETGWNYDKLDIRRVIKIEGNKLWVHKPFRWPHDPAETGHRVNVFSPAEGNISGIHFLSDGNSYGAPKVVLSRLTGGTLSDGSYTGKTVGWTGGIFMDGPHLVNCVGVHLSWDITNGRYCPHVSASYGCRYHDATVKGIRHFDTNSWSEDNVFENIIGLQTQGVVQSHPNTGNIFRNITDSLMDDILAGYDLRGLGETIEHCRSVSVARQGKSNTCAPLIKSEWLPQCTKYIRRVSDYYAPRLTMRHGKDGWNIYENVRSHDIKGQWNEAAHTRIFIDPSCVSRTTDAAAAPDKDANEQRGPVIVPFVKHYRSNADPVAIDAISEASPAVVTAAGHGLTDGDVVWIYDGSGEHYQMQTHARVANASADTFEVMSLDGTPFDYTAPVAPYSSGGKVTRQEEVDCINAGAHPATGHLGKMHFLTKLAEGLTGSSSYTREFTYRAYHQDNIDQQGRNAIFTFRAGSGANLSERRFHVGYDQVNPSSAILTEIGDFDSDNGALDITDVSATRHLQSEVTAEGTSFWPGDFGARYFIAFSVTVTAAEAVDWLEVEVEDWRNSPLRDDVIAFR